MNDQLSHVAQLLKSHHGDAARAALDSYLADSPRDAQAWYLLSFAADTSAQKIAAAQRALSLNPQSLQFQARLKQLQAMPRSARMSRPRLLLLIGLSTIAGLVVLINIILLSHRPPQASQMPTLMAFAISATSVSPTQGSILPQGIEAPGSNLMLPVLSPREAALIATAMPTVANQPVSSDTPASATKTASETPAAISIRSDASVTIIQAATEVIPTSVEIAAVSSPTREATIIPSSVAPTQTEPVSLPTSATPVQSPLPVQNGVPLNTVLNIGVGDMRVINATRHAEGLIQELGGSMPTPPINQSWVLVEVLLVCQDKSTCRADPSSFEIIGSSGARYAASSQIAITPILGSVVSNGQIWGYLGFVTPNSEDNLHLVMSQNDQSYAFILESD